MKKRYLFFGALLLNAFNSQSQLFELGGCFKTTSEAVNDVCWDYPYILVFEDEFEFLNQKTWGNKWPQGATPNEDIQEWNTLDNVTIDNGKAIITAKYDPALREQAAGNGPLGTDGNTNLRPYAYTSASLWSNYIFGNGYFEMLCKLPEGAGYWPAFWLYNGYSGLGSPELDIFEMMNNNPYDVSMTIHNHNKQCGETRHIETSSPWIKFGAYWDNWKIVWMINDIPIQGTHRWYLTPPFPIPLNCEVAEQNPGIEATVNDVFPMTPMQIVFNLAVRNGTPNPNPINFPGKLEVEYIRFYQQRKNCDVVKTYTSTSGAELGLDDDAMYLANLGKPYYHHMTGRIININGNVTILNHIGSTQIPQQLKLTAAEEFNFDLDPVTGLPVSNSSVIFDIQPGAIFEAVIDPNVCSNTPSHLPPMDEVRELPDRITEGLANETGTLGLDTKVLKTERIAVSPNPSNQDVVTLMSPEGTKVIIMNSQGIKVKEVEVQAGSNQLNVQDLSSGVYQLYFEALKETIKLVRL